jgi:hypothetical protein
VGESWVDKINGTDAAKLAGLAANLIQIGTFIDAYFQPDSGDVLDAIDALKQEIEVDFEQLGDLVAQQTQLVLKDIDTVALADALAHSATAMDHLATWLRTKNDPDLEFALNESDLGIQFFLALPATADDPGQASQTQPYFLPGMAKAGTVRTCVLTARDGTALWRVHEDVEEVTEIIALLEGMIDSIEATVNAAHIVEWGKVPDTADPVEWAYFHEEAGTVLETFTVGPLATNEASYEQVQKRVAQMLKAAQAARAQGVTGELGFMGIPTYQALIDTRWKVAITDPVRVQVGGARAVVGAERR